MGDAEMNHVVAYKSDVSPTEYPDIVNYFVKPEIGLSSWTANFSGSLSNDVELNMSREGSSANEALKALEEAMKEQGWTLI